MAPGNSAAARFDAPGDQMEVGSVADPDTLNRIWNLLSTDHSKNRGLAQATSVRRESQRH